MLSALYSLIVYTPPLRGYIKKKSAQQSNSYKERARQIWLKEFLGKCEDLEAACFIINDMFYIYILYYHRGLSKENNLDSRLR